MASPPPANGEILVVEDTPASLELLTSLLTEAGYTVRPAQEGRMALRSARARPPELILLDIRMPGMDGYEVCQQLKSDLLTRDIPVIFLSALRDTEDKVHAFSLGAVDYIAKPYQPEEVLARVRNHLELHRLQCRLEERVSERTAQIQAAEAALRQSQSQLRELASFLQSVREEERTRIARELHDELGQALTALRIDLNWLRLQYTAHHLPALQERAGAAYAQIEHTIDSVRRISEGLRPGMLDTLGLAAAIEHHVNEFEARSHIPCHLSMNREEFRLKDNLAITLFRLVQEALTNIARHAQADEVWIDLKEDREAIHVSIADDGCGFDPTQAGGTFGLLGMQERVTMLGGKLILDSQPGQGTRIRARFPHHEKTPHDQNPDC